MSIQVENRMKSRGDGEMRCVGLDPVFALLDMSQSQSLSLCFLSAVFDADHTTDLLWVTAWRSRHSEIKLHPIHGRAQYNPPYKSTVPTPANRTAFLSVQPVTELSSPSNAELNYLALFLEHSAGVMAEMST